MAKGYPQPKSFSHAVKIFKQIDFDYTRTAFTNEEYVYDPETCMRKLFLKKDHKKYIDFVRIVPEKLVARSRQCFTEKICTNSSGKPYKGLRCCRRIDKQYQDYDRDIFNVIPIVKGTKYLSITPPLHARGNMARVYLYMNAQYGLNLSYEKQMRYLQWHNEDKVDEKECAIHDKIKMIQGRSNPWIQSSCEILRSKSSKSSQE